MTAEEKSRFLINLPWLGILILIILAIAFLLPVLPNDFWWYLRLGKDIAVNHAVPTIETYSSTSFGTPVEYPMWLSAVLFHAIFQLGELTTIVLVRGLLIASFYVILWIIVVKKGIPGWLVTILTLVCALAGANNWAVRPQIFVYPLFGLSLLILELNNSETLEKTKKFDTSILRKFIWLIPIALFWVNLHGSVILLFLLIIPYFLFHQSNRTFLLIIILTFLATLINPRGINLWLDTFQILQATGNQFSQEWKPPTNTGWQMNIFFLWLLLFIPLVVFSRNKLKVHQWIWFLGFGWMALSGVRYVIWFLAILLIFTCYMFSDLLKFRTNSKFFPNLKLNIALLIILSLLPLSFLPGFRESWWKLSPPVLSNNTPVEASKWINQNIDSDEKIFNDYVFGSYFVYAIPDYPVWIDTRFHIYELSTWEDYLSISKGEPGWLEKLHSYQIEHLILSNDSQKNLLLSLEKNNYYCLVYEDEIASIFSPCH